MSPHVDPDVRLARRRLRIVAALFAVALVGLSVRLVELALPSGEAAVAASAPISTRPRRAPWSLTDGATAPKADARAMSSRPISFNPPPSTISRIAIQNPSWE
jgi:hypothetical protein